MPGGDAHRVLDRLLLRLLLHRRLVHRLLLHRLLLHRLLNRCPAVRLDRLLHRHLDGLVDVLLHGRPLRRRRLVRGRPCAPPPPHRRTPASAAGSCAPRVIRRFVTAAFST
ncbi:hypothetical protein [Actinomadura sp. NTSP31]|uniref:hypothetical protein n=1 Tax=Actinomadura sp. NTSP31 TaxID=1735447 RepID=UPI0035BF7FD9